MKRVLCGLLLLLAASPSMAATPSERVEEFLGQVTTSQSDQAYDQLFAGSGFAEQKPQELKTIKSQTKMAMGLYGKPLGIEKIREEDLSPSIKRLVYIQKFESFPVAWEFYFYKAHDTWTLNTINFKDQISSILGLE
jgi:hypothetical protein